jgi:hypothetical protein
VVKKKTTTEIRLYQIEQPAGGLAEGSEDLSERERVPQEPVVSPPVGWRYRCTFAKTGPAIFLSHLEFVDALRRAVSRAKLPIRFSQGFHPLPKISFGPAMAVGKEAFDQTFTLDLEQSLVPAFIQERLNYELPEGLVVHQITCN